MAAAAIDVVAQQKMWTLADDIEHVLAHRDARDWYVFEAASWALAERRMPAERRRELWLEPLPAAELAGRLAKPAALRVAQRRRAVSRDRCRPSGASRSGDACSSRKAVSREHPPAPRRRRSPHRAETVRRGGWIRPLALGFAEALSGTAMRETVRTVDTTVTLALSVEELRTLLSENTDLVTGLFATLAGPEQSAPKASCTTRQPAPSSKRSSPDGLAPVEKVLALQRVPVFSRVSCRGNAVSSPRSRRPFTMVPASPLFVESTPPAVWLLLVRRSRIWRAPAAPLLAAAGGDVIGSIEHHGGQGPGTIGEGAVATRMALKLDRDDLFGADRRSGRNCCGSCSRGCSGTRRS